MHERWCSGFERIALFACPSPTFHSVVWTCEEMEDLCPRRVWGFSTGCILAPGRWTLDVASHHLSHTHVKGGKTATDSAAPGNNNIREDGLPLGTSSNTARFESMDETGATLYVTELFVPHVSHANDAGTAASDASGQSSWSAERLRASLLRQPSWRASPAQGRDSAASPATAAAESGCVERERVPLRAWVVEVTAPPSPSSTLAAVSPSASADIATTTAASCSIAAALLPFFRLFLEVVWDGGTSTSAVSRTVDDAVHRIVAHLESLYRTPALELDGFRCFVGGAAASDAAPGGSARVSPPSAKAMTAASVVTQLREPCSPHALADMGTDALSSAWGASLYSAAGAAFVQLLQPSSALQPPPPPHQSAVDEAHGSQSCWSLYLVSVFPAARHGGAASAVQHLLQHDLQLCWEGLALSTALAGAETVVAVAALPLDSAGAEPSSIYSFPSVERAWEVHVHRFLSQQRGQERTRGLGRDATGVDSAVGRHDTVREWELRRLSTSSRPVSEQLDAMLHKAELQQCVVDDPSLSSGARSMRLVARDVGAPLVAPRCTSYLLRIRRGAAGGEQVRANVSDDHAYGFAAVQTPAATDATHTDTQAEERYVLQLHAPRVLSTHALVVCMAVPTSLVAKESRPGKRAATEGGTEASAVSADDVGDLAAAAAAALSAMYRIAPYVPSLWLPCEVALRGGSGICSRSGRLLLHVPACDARYGNIHVAPVASNVFTTLGSIIAWSAQSPLSRQGDAAGRDTSSPVSPTCASLANTCAVWTLIGDGRSAAAYLEDTLSEYMYDTGAKSLLNVGQPSQHERQPGLFLVRRKQKKRYSTTGTATVSGAAKGTMSSLAVQEVCSAWLDVGETHRLFLSVRDVGAGEVLLAKGSLVGPHTEFLRRDRTSRDAVTAALEAASRAEEEALEEWIGGVAAAAVAPQRR
ncbi:conserved hypothetical protein [Leishmania major strain Friedlin]|uniref:Uncharacterized protein n=1 Tax=Leishmania major TaxID=5664 RepID=Q4QIQ4_LEIMA|nr:conserved hypothetical protein [Leishmania major strain Friedlin]CAG9568975.1 hypothetical_protein_-_conserved [Leishmania major strain Friedlin]CAJ06999.1 conserved hypothetical protein [Leishmania major strain Friedlin]|eukprot:XP_001680944.1 conserved hypothetical protein [Leishmania major strain Friedlin]